MKKKVVLSVAVVLLVVMVAAICVACTPSMDSVEKKFQNKGYKTFAQTDNTLTMTKFTDAIIPTPESSITIVWYENEDKAKEAYEAKLKVGSEDTVKRKGNAVATGDKDAIKIF